MGRERGKRYGEIGSGKTITRELGTDTAMHIEVDQSGKIGDTKVPTVLAFSNADHCSLLIPATVKRTCLNILRQRGKSGTTLYMQLFAVGLYLLLKDHICDLDQIVIDEEYPGRNNEIKLYLLNLLWRSGSTVSSAVVQFHNIGKKSRAHHWALTVFTRAAAPNRIVKVDEILSEF
jgi:hypothetical protein